MQINPMQSRPIAPMQPMQQPMQHMQQPLHSMQQHQNIPQQIASQKTELPSFEEFNDKNKFTYLNQNENLQNQQQQQQLQPQQQLQQQQMAQNDNIAAATYPKSTLLQNLNYSNKKISNQIEEIINNSDISEILEQNNNNIQEQSSTKVGTPETQILHESNLGAINTTSPFSQKKKTIFGFFNLEEIQKICFLSIVIIIFTLPNINIFFHEKISKIWDNKIFAVCAIGILIAIIYYFLANFLQILI